MTHTTQQLLARRDAFDVSDPGRPVSMASALSDLVWRLDSSDPQHPQGTIAVGWRPAWADERPMCDQEASLILDMQRIAWAALVDKAVTDVRKPATLITIGTGARAMVRFMLENGLEDLSCLTPQVADAFAEWLAVDLARGTPQRRFDSIHVASAYQRTSILSLIWKTRRHLAAAGRPVPSASPLRGRTAASLAAEISDRAAEMLPPIPDEAFVQIVNSACEVLLVHSADVLEAQRIWFDETGGLGSEPDRVRGTRRLEEFELSTKGSASTWWPKSLLDPELTRAASAKDGLAKLVTALRDACTIIVLATAGLRVGELLAAPGGRTLDGRLPACLARQRSEDGLLETYTLVSKLVKGQIVPLGTDWLVGSRPSGVGPLPLGALAIDALERLMAPWASLGHSERARAGLLVKFNGRIGLPRTGRMITRVTSGNLTSSCRRFYERFVRFDDLPDRSTDPSGADVPQGMDLRSVKADRGSSILNQQYRKNYAKNLMRIDTGLLPALKVQMKHMRQATSQLKYVGNDPSVGAGSEQRLAAGVAFASFLGFVEGAEAGVGRLAQLINGQIASLDAKEPRNDEAAVDPRQLAELGFTLIPGDYGWCGLQLAPHRSRCNELGGGASVFSERPDERHRSPTTCLGCSLFGFDASHGPFWQARHRTNRDIWEDAKAAGVEDDYRVAEARMKQAAAVLRSIGREPEE